MKLSLNEMLMVLKPTLNEKVGKITSSIDAFFNAKREYVIFLSATNKKQRAVVVNGRGSSFETSWKNAVQNLRKTTFAMKINPIAVKADLVTEIETVSFSNLLARQSLLTRNYFRKGIAFDRLFRRAFLEQEVNANVFFNNWGNQHVEMAETNMNTYMKVNRNLNFRLSKDYAGDVHLFDTVSVFHDGETVIEICTGDVHNGRRNVDVMDRQIVFNLLHHASQKLSNQVTPSGKFDYVYYPPFAKSNPVYDVIHHALAVEAMLESYELTQDAALKQSIELAISFLIEKSFDLTVIDNVEYIFVKDTENENNIKLGATAHVLLVMIKYVTVFGDVSFESILDKLVNGILYFRQVDGSFVYRLNNDKAIIKEHGSSYSEGAAMLGLVRYLQLKENELLSKQIEQSLALIITKKFLKKADHWLNHAIIEFFYMNPKLEYAEWSIKSVNYHLNSAFSQDTDVKTIIELFVPTYFLIQVLQDNEIHFNELKNFELDKFRAAIWARAEQQLNAFIWPELAMYFAVPSDAENRFFVREDSFRSRIDDSAFNISSYYYLFVLLQDAFEKDNLVELMVDQQSKQEVESLFLAKLYEKQQEWIRGINSFHYMNDTETYMDVTYATYGYHLRMNGQISESREVLGVGNKLYPTSEVILLELLRLSMQVSDYHAVIVIAGDLIKIDATESQYYFELGRAYTEVGDIEKAKSSYKIGLIHQHNMSTEKLIERIERNITDDLSEITTKFDYLGGLNNLGVLLHELQDKELFTKITRTNGSSLREGMFYREILSQYDSLEEIVPKHFATEIMDDVQYITMEKIEHIKKEVSIEEIIELVETVSSVSYGDIVNDFPNPTYLHTIQYNIGPHVVNFFTEIHRKEQNELLLKTLEGYFLEQELSNKINPILHRIERVIMDHELYKFIHPEKHYSLLHGDFKVGNLSVRTSDEQLQVLDWGSFAIGPRFMDMVYLLAELFPTFEAVKEKYLDNVDVNRPLEVAEKIYFSFALIVFYCIKIKAGNEDRLINNFVLPIVAYMEETVKEL